MMPRPATQQSVLDRQEWTTSATERIGITRTKNSMASSTTNDYIIQTGSNTVTPQTPVIISTPYVRRPKSQQTKRHKITEGCKAWTPPCITSAVTREIYHNHCRPILGGAGPLPINQTERVQLLPIHQASCCQGWTRQGGERHQTRSKYHWRFYSKEHQGENPRAMQRRR